MPSFWGSAALVLLLGSAAAGGPRLDGEQCSAAGQRDDLIEPDPASCENPPCVSCEEFLSLRVLPEMKAIGGAPHTLYASG